MWIHVSQYIWYKKKEKLLNGHIYHCYILERVIFHAGKPKSEELEMPRLTNEEKAAIKEQFKQQKMAEKLALKEEMKKKKQEEMQKRKEEKALVNNFVQNLLSKKNAMVIWPCT